MTSEPDEQRRRAITRWWERQTLREFIARKRANLKDQTMTSDRSDLATRASQALREQLAAYSRCAEWYRKHGPASSADRALRARANLKDQTNDQ
jgi:hypothetical protein